MPGFPKNVSGNPYLEGMVFTGSVCQIHAFTTRASRDVKDGQCWANECGQDVVMDGLGAALCGSGASPPIPLSSRETSRFVYPRMTCLGFLL